MKSFQILGVLAFAGLLLYCTPKTTRKVQQDITDKDSKKELNLDSILNDPCRTWTNLPNKDEVIEMHVIYRDFINTEKYEEAFPYWLKVYKAAPRADGRRWTHFEDGLKLYHNKYLHAVKEEEKASYVKEMHEIVRLWKQCSSQGQSISKSYGEIAFTLYYEYRDVFDDKYIYDLFEEAVEHSGEHIPVFIFNPFSRLLVDLVEGQKIEQSKGGAMAMRLLEGLDYGLKHCSEQQCKSWDIVKSYTPDVLGRLERFRGLYDCAYYKERYLPKFKEDSSSCDVIDEVFLKLRWGGCSSDDAEVASVIEAKSRYCKVISKNSDLLAAAQSLEAGRFKEAITHYKTYISHSTDASKKAKITFRIAQVYYAYLKDFPKARKYALKAAKLKPGWGAPYLMIGTLYASSGPLCGSGRGWNSQIVVWPAIDKWNYAKKIDPSVRSKANKYINTYKKYMPDGGEIHQRLLKPGQKFKVVCWINETTVIRAAP